MSRVEVDCKTALPASAEAVWGVVRDFASDWHPDIVSVAVETAPDGGMIRAFDAADGGRYRERLTYVSDSDRMFRYTLLAGIPVDSYRAEARVTPAATGCVLRWRAEIEGGAHLDAIAKGTEAVFRNGFRWLAENPPSAPAPVKRRARKPAKIVRRHVGDAPRLSCLAAGGAGETLVLFLHGIGGAAENWRPQLRQMDRPAAALDLRGYGESELGPARTTVENHCADILAVMRDRGAQRVVLVGLSMGAWIAMSFAMRHPELLAGLVCAGGCTGMSEADTAEREAFLAAREAPLAEGKTPADFAPAVVEVIAGPDASTAQREELRRSMADIPAATYRDALTCFCNPPERFDFGRLACPVLMVTGEHDVLAPSEEIRGVSLRIHGAMAAPDVRFEVIPGAGHICNLLAPEAFNAHLGAFLARLPGAPLGKRERQRAAKGRRILDGALAEFCESGFEGASMEAIARRAKVSKPTLYQYFGDKDGLFDAVLEEGRTHLLTPLLAAEGTLVDRLWNFSWTYAEFVLRPDMLSLARLVLGEAARRPETAAAYHRAGPGRAFAGIVAFVRGCVADGLLEVDDVELAAQDLWSLILSGPRDHYLHFVRETPEREGLRRSIGHGLGVFLKAYSTRAEADLAALAEKIASE